MAGKSEAGSASQWDRFVATRVLPLVERLLQGEVAPSGHDVPPLKVGRDQWGVVVLSRTGIVDATWVESLVKALRASKRCQGYTIEFAAREVVPIRTLNDARDPSIGRVKRVEDATDTAKLRTAMNEAVRRFGKDHIRLEVALRHRR